jgi:hypothetical protein
MKQPEPHEIRIARRAIGAWAATALLVAVLCACPAFPADFSPFRIAAAGQPKAVIVMPENAGPAVESVANELRDYLGKITGARFETRGDRAALPTGLNAIDVGRTRFAANSGVTADGLEKEGFRITTRGSHLFLLGRDDDGTQFAVYEFLEKYCGVRWFFPGEFGQEVPRNPNLAVKARDERQAPYFLRRTMYLAWSKGDEPVEVDYQRFGRKWKVGSSVKTVGVHTWGKIIPPAELGPAHPEYFALVNGTRQRDWSKFDGSHEYQLCTGNPEVVRRSIDWVRRYFTEHPDADVLSISPNDGLGFCECERCRALDSGETLEMYGKKHPELADRIITYANAVAEGLTATHPDKRLLILAYTVYRRPPVRVLPHKNLVVQYADNAEFHYDAARKAERLGGLESWAHLTPNLMIYEYYVWGGYVPARGLTPMIVESIQRFQRLGIRLFRTQSRADYGLSGLNYYLAAKLLWNPQLDPNLVLDDYFRTCFGRAAQPMKEYFRLLDERWKAAVLEVGTTDLTPQTALYFLVSFNPAARARLRALLDQAAKAADTPAHQARVGFFAQAYRYSELTVEGAEQMLELERAGVVTVDKKFPTRVTAFRKPGELAPADRARAVESLRQAVARWEARGKFMDEIKGRYVIDDAYARACDTHYEFNPLEKLREIAKLY